MEGTDRLSSLPTITPVVEPHLGSECLLLASSRSCPMRGKIFSGWLTVESLVLTECPAHGGGQWIVSKRMKRWVNKCCHGGWKREAIAFEELMAPWRKQTKSLFQYQSRCLEGHITCLGPGRQASQRKSTDGDRHGDVTQLLTPPWRHTHLSYFCLSPQGARRRRWLNGDKETEWGSGSWAPERNCLEWSLPLPNTG